MWVFLNNAFVSIVEDRNEPHWLLVRARRREDITRVFPGAQVKETENADYLFRAWLPRPEVSRGLSHAVSGIDYSNFKGSIRERDLSGVCHRVWWDVLPLQRPGLDQEERNYLVDPGGAHL